MADISTQQIRNVVLLGHGGAGKTTLTEAILHCVGAITRQGSVDNGTTVTDFEDLEKERNHSIDPSLACVEADGLRLNIIDAPGYPDFIGGAISAMMGADTGIVVVSAASGIEVNTRRLFQAAGTYGLARMIVINKINADNVDLPALMAAIKEMFGSSCVPLNAPAADLKSVVDILGGESGDSALGDIADLHTELMDSIVEIDEDLMERYLGGEEVSQDELKKALATAVVSGDVIPVVFTSADEEVGVKELIQVIEALAPDPTAGPKRKLIVGEGEDATVTEIEPDPSATFIGQAFRVFSDPKSNIKYSAIRVLSGTLTSDTSLHVGDSKGIRPGHLFSPFGSEEREVQQGVAGDIVALAKIEEISTGVTVHAGIEGRVECPKLPQPMYSLAIEPKSRGDEQKISTALHRISEEDPTFKVDRDEQTGEMVVSGIGDLHLRIIFERLHRRFKLEVTTKLPKIPYRETISGQAEGHHRHKKQSGGAGQFGEVYLKVEPLGRDEGFEFVDEIFGGSIPGQFLPAVEKGVRDLLAKGAVAGFPLQDVRVRVYDGKHHPVDSKEVAFRTAGRLAMRDAIQKAKPVLLEPVVNLEVTVPANFVGDITSDLAGRRGRIAGQDMLPGNMATIRALVPLAEVAQYDSQLRSVTGGQGSYSIDFSHYDPVPGNVQQEIIKQYQPKEEEEE